jgi:Ala-tRNA(Pro) deacylase
MLAKRLKKFLKDNKIDFEIHPHSTAYTTQETAEKARIKGKRLAKTVMVRIDDEVVMAVLPGDEMLDPELLKRASGGGRVEVLKEDEFSSLFPDCEVGAMPPFGNLYNIKVWVDADLGEVERISFNGGNHEELCTIAYSDFENIVKPVRANIHRKYKATG